MEPDSQHNIFIDDRPDSYKDFLSTNQGSSLSEAACPSPGLNEFVDALLLDWRATSYTASMPGILITSLHSVMDGWLAYESPDGSIAKFADLVLIALSRKIPQVIKSKKLRVKIKAELLNQAALYQEARSSTSTSIDITDVWNDYMKIPPFQMSVWSSQRVAYTAFYNAYEAFLVQCVKKVLGKERLRTTDGEFKIALRQNFSSDICDACWSSNSLNSARLVRHALSHASGRETIDLAKQSHNIKVVNKVLQITPDDNRELVAMLHGAVTTLVVNAVGLPQFAE
ncbi:MAG: hypothetical protein WDZ51_13680 [Pirellulaceae bacterium]